MERKKSKLRAEEGRLPAYAPLANPYVPFQLENSPRYEADMALVRGTLYPGLDLPFMGMVNNNNKISTPLVELQTLCFAIQELALYLDTHRDDKEALEVYRTFQRMYNEHKEIYQKKCGPLNHSFVGEGEYNWLDDPWPWEYAMNREVQ